MARAIRYREVTPFRTSTAVPGLKVDPIAYFSPPRGINTLAALSRVPNEFSPVLKNFILDEGRLRSRMPTEAVGTESSVTIMAIIPFTAQDGVSLLLRVTTTGLESWNGFTWNAIAGVTFTGTIHDRFTWTSWGNELLLCNGVDKIVSYNAITGVGKVLTESFPCRHLTSFNGRVIASAVVEGSFLPYRTRWCVKLNNEDWTSETTEDGIGAGYEDVLATPGGTVDEVVGVFPLSDDVALMVREFSLRFMNETGDVNAPFRFPRLAGAMGSRTRHGIQITPHGIVVPTIDDILLVTQGGWQSLGEPIRRQFHSEVIDYKDLSSAYDPTRQEYRIANGQEVWRYSFIDKGWTKDTYPFTINNLSYVNYKTLGLTFDELVGTFDELEGTFDELTRDFSDESMHFVANNVTTARESITSEDDFGVDSGLEARTGLLQADSPLHRTELIEVQLEYESEVTQELTFEFSLDRGLTWNNYSVITVQPTNGPTVLQVRRTLTHHNLQVRLRTDTLGKLIVLAMYVFAARGVKVNA